MLTRIERLRIAKLAIWQGCAFAALAVPLNLLAGDDGVPAGYLAAFGVALTMAAALGATLFPYRFKIKSMLRDES